MSKEELFKQRLEDALQWRRDVASGELKESYQTLTDFDNTYAGFDEGISSADLDRICEESQNMGDNLCICWHMGELRPATKE